jgi:uncharacterized secreted protein with C-terminal beta-propeller domain
MTSTRTRRQRSVPLTLEALEDRQLLDAGGITPPLAPLSKFASIADFDKHFIDQAVAQFGTLFGTKVSGTGISVTPLEAGAAQTSQLATTQSIVYPGINVGAVGSPSSSPQVPGVGEGDLVQTDGTHLFVLSQNQLVVLDRTENGGLVVDSRHNVPVNPVTMFLDGNRLWVISQVRSSLIYYASPLASLPFLPYDPPFNYSPRLEVTAYDISAAGSATLVEDKLFDGTFVAARSVSDHLYLVTQNGSTYLPAPQLLPNGDGSASYETQDAYIARITPQLPDLVLPHVYQAGGSVDNPVSTGLLSEPLDVYQGRSSQDTVENSILTFNMTAAGGALTDVQTFLSSYQSAIYATTTHLYFVTTHYSTGDNPATSVIQSFTIGGDHVSPEAAGVVPGAVSGQFALDESNGYLRVATASNSSNSQSIGVYEFQRDGTDLKMVGSAVGLAAGDYLTAVRFAGTSVYLATARYTSPASQSLLVVDLTDPIHPALASQLDLSGRVSYLQMLDDSHLFALGYDDNVELTLLDVHNSQAPAVIDHLVVTGSDGQTTWSPAEYNPAALAFSADRHFLALPIRLNSVAAYGDYTSLDDLYRIDFQSGFHLVGSVEHDSQVERSLLDTPNFYSIADSTVKAQAIVTQINQGGPPSYVVGPSQEVRLVDNPREIQVPTLEVGADHTLVGSVLNFTVSDLTGLTATIDWGDGTSSVGNILLSDNHVFSVAGQHTYTGHGRFSITVNFTRDGQSAGSYYNPIQVDPIDPQIEYFLHRVYLGLLQRPVDEAGLEHWSDALNQGASRQFVTQSIMQSTEYYNVQIQYLYSQLLNRAADGSGLATWTSFLTAGHSLDEVRTGILSSLEYFAKSGSNAGFVADLYVDLFSRQADPVGQFAWQTVLQLGLPRDQAVGLLAHSHEAAVHDVMVQFGRYLGRSADLDGLLYFAGAEQGGHTSQDVAAAIMGSQEFLLRTQTDINKNGGF